MAEPDEGSWQVVVTATAVQSLDRLLTKIAAAIVELITVTLLINPHRLSKPLRYEFEGWRVALRGGYRVTFRLDTAASISHQPSAHQSSRGRTHRMDRRTGAGPSMTISRCQPDTGEGP